MSNLTLKLSFFVDRKKKDNEYGVSRGVDFQGDNFHIALLTMISSPMLRPRHYSQAS